MLNRRKFFGMSIMSLVGLLFGRKVIAKDSKLKDKIFMTLESYDSNGKRSVFKRETDISEKHHKVMVKKELDSIRNRIKDDDAYLEEGNRFFDGERFDRCINLNYKIDLIEEKFWGYRSGRKDYMRKIFGLL